MQTSASIASCHTIAGSHSSKYFYLFAPFLAFFFFPTDALSTTITHSSVSLPRLNNTIDPTKYVIIIGTPVLSFATSSNAYAFSNFHQKNLPKARSGLSLPTRRSQIIVLDVDATPTRWGPQRHRCAARMEPPNGDQVGGETWPGGRLHFQDLRVTKFDLQKKRTHKYIYMVFVVPRLVWHLGRIHTTIPMGLLFRR